jgi:hypothetical protein
VSPRRIALAAGLLGMACTLPAHAADTATAATETHAAPAATTPADAPWARRAQWMSVRAGYAKIAAEGAPDGLAGYGFGYVRFIMNRWSVGGYVHHELLGRFVHSTAIEVPMTVEVVRHTRWGPGLHPYGGIGAGAFYYKFYRTGEDLAGFRAGRYITMGFTSPVAHEHLLGLDIRVAWLDRVNDSRLFGGAVNGNPSLPVAFKRPISVVNTGYTGSSETHWSVKLNYAFAY